jgi:hypothetical protein
VRPRAFRSVALAALLATACASAAGAQEQRGERTPLTTIIGIDVSGSFRNAGLFNEAVEFIAHYIYAHLNGFGELRVPTALFFTSIGGVRAGEPKPFHPINDFEGRSVQQIAADIRSWFSQTDPYTDFNSYFARVATLVKERGLVLAPLNIIVLSDGVPDAPVHGSRAAASSNPYARIDLSPLEYLSRSVTLRLLYASPSVGDNWKKLIKRRRVRIWAQEAQVMAGWRKQVQPDVALSRQDRLWRWVQDNVDFRVRTGGMF